MRRGDGPAITGPGECKRVMYAGERQFKLVQSWRLKEGRGVEITTKLFDPKAGKRAAARNSGTSEACEEDLSKVAREKADEIMKGKREAARRAGGGGEAAFSKFFEWPDYVHFMRIWKSEKGEDIKDPGRTLFLSTRKKTYLYLKALREVDVQGRAACDCRWCSAPDGQAAWKGMWKHLGKFSEALAYPKVDLREGDPEDEVGFMACSAMECTLCGFGKEGGIPTSKALETSQQVVKCTRYEDVERPGKKPLQNQQVEKEGKLCDLWADFKKHSKLYIAHHAKAKWQTNSHGLCLSTFQDGDIVIETDFIEKYSHVPGTVLTCAGHPQTTLMVAIVHCSPQLWEGGGRVHQTETWIFASEDPAHDFDFHRHALTQIADYYLDGPGSDATAAAREAQRIPRMHMFTDGCAKQYNGRRNFLFLADSVRQLGCIVEHHFSATSHLKGCHDGIGGVAKNAMRMSEKRGDLIAGAAGVVKFLKEYFEHIGAGNKELADNFATWSPYCIWRVHVKIIGLGAVYRPEQQLKGITGTRDAYLFVGANAGLMIPTPKLP
ncbi:unnamed protein product [Ectocarpus sp. CCAP 1310/34]|nr:unnamed protein product [Ectocarpus sp. CCAP 1310/34]